MLLLEPIALVGGVFYYVGTMYEEQSFEDEEPDPLSLGTNRGASLGRAS
jgi:hypothetical protein